MAPSEWVTGRGWSLPPSPPPPPSCPVLSCAVHPVCTILKRQQARLSALYTHRGRENVRGASDSLAQSLIIHHHSFRTETHLSLVQGYLGTHACADVGIATHVQPASHAYLAILHLCYTLIIITADDITNCIYDEMRAI